MGDDAGAAAGMEGLVIGEGMEVVAGILGDEFGNVEVLNLFIHGGESYRLSVEAAGG